MIYIVEIEHMSEINHTTEIGLIVEIDCETITKVTIEMTTEMNIEMKIIETRYISKNTKIIIKDTYDKGGHRTSYKNKGRSKDKCQSTNRYRDDSYDKTEAGLEKDIVHMMQGKLLTDQNLN